MRQVTPPQQRLVLPNRRVEEPPAALRASLEGATLIIGVNVSGGEDPRKADIEQANSQLEQGLKSCRSVIANYKVILAGERHAHVSRDGVDGADAHAGDRKDERA